MKWNEGVEEKFEIGWGESLPDKPSGSASDSGKKVGREPVKEGGNEVGREPVKEVEIKLCNMFEGLVTPLISQFSTGL